METPPPHTSPTATPALKKGLGTGAKIGIGCAAIVGLVIVGIVVVGIMFGGKFKDFAEEAQKNPSRATATMMVKASAGTLELVAEDDVNKRYTVKDKKSGELTTIYWSEKKKAPEVVQGDFTAIPAEPATAAADSLPVPETEK